MYQNRVSIIGLVGNDAQLRKTKTGASVAVFSVATKSSWKNASGSSTPAQIGIAAWPGGRSPSSRPRSRKGLTYKSRVSCVTANTRKSTARRKRRRPSSIGSSKSASTASSNSTARRSRMNLLPRSIPPNFPPTSPPVRGHPLGPVPSGLRPFLCSFMREPASVGLPSWTGRGLPPGRGGYC
jgi:Single-strand binding protein family